MADTKAALISRLSEARVRLTRQINILVGTGVDYGMKRELQIGDLLEQLQTTLDALEECIAALEEISE